MAQVKLDDQLSAILAHTLGAAAASLPEGSLRWEMPKDPAFGDLANAAAFKLASVLKRPPQALAADLAARFAASAAELGLGDLVDRAEQKSGFLNVFLSQKALLGILQEILDRGPTYGTAARTARESVNIEFVSANPTGPLSVAHGRQAAVGDVLARLLQSQGYDVTREYYLNDEGRQIEQLGRSLRIRYRELFGKAEPMPEDGYLGLYVADVAKRFAEKYGEKYADMPEKEALPAFMEFGMAEMLDLIKTDLSHFNLNFEEWSSQRWVRETGKIDAALEHLKQKDALFEAEDALWFASTKFGDDKDRVVRKRDGELTYLAPDIAYHEWKYQRGFSRVINLWGPDHHGYIARVKAAVAALGLDPERLVVRIVQLVTLSRKGKPVPMSKRQGEFVRFREIMDEVGVDATRFFFLMRTMESHLDFDLELAKSQSNENPVYYVQYAYARICSILSKAPEANEKVSLERLVEPEERLLVRTLFQYPVVLRLCATALEPHGITTYLRKLAESFHVFYTKHRVITEDQGLTLARLELVRAAKQVLGNGLGLLGISAPERM